MITEVKKEIEKNHLCSRSIIEKIVIDVACKFNKSGYIEYDSKVEELFIEELFIEELFGYSILCTILKDATTQKITVPILKIEPVGRVQKLYEELIYEGYEAIIYCTGESIYVSPIMKISEGSIVEKCKQNNFYISTEVLHPEKKDEICWKITPICK